MERSGHTAGGVLDGELGALCVSGSDLVDMIEDRLGDVVNVKYMGLDKKGRMDFSIKDAIAD